jgi:TPR repeat protein
MGIMLYDGKGGPKDRARGINYLKQASLQGFHQADYRLHLIYDMEDDYEKAFPHLQKTLEATGYPPAYTRLGVYYEQGTGCEKDSVKAFENFQIAAEKGDSDGMEKLSRCYQEGTGCEIDRGLAFHWAQEGAKLEHPDQLCRLGECYLYGIGVPVDFDAAAQWFGKASEKKENLLGHYFFGYVLMNGMGIPKDEQRAVRLFRYRPPFHLD